MSNVEAAMQMQMQMKQPNPTLILESGISLSEQAHEAFSPSTEATSSSHSSSASATFASVEDLRQQILDDTVGSSAVITSPLEVRPGQAAKLPLVYCDFTASHRPLQSIENYIAKNCLPLYGNTHTNTSITGSQSTAFCSEARQILGEACGAKTTGKASKDVVLFAGNGTTCAVQLLIDVLGLKHALSDPSTKPVIFVGPYEHHSNLLPWRELGNVQIEMIQPRVDGNVDLEHLESLLKQYATTTIKIGSFSAVSNITGIVADHLAITALLHKYGALSVWDYATGASYMDIEMNPTNPDYSPESIAKDAVVWSGHKVAGGVGSPGVLVVKKHLVSQQNPPSRSGGGTVFYVAHDHHRFLSNRIERYEGGTPNVVGIWRLGLAMAFKQQVKRDFQKILESRNTNKKGEGDIAPQSLTEYDYQRAQQIQERLSRIPNLILMDGQYSDTGATPTTSSKKVPIYSFLIKCGSRFLHYNYVCALLNDLFGIQSRGGCQCAGPYAQHLLGLRGNTNMAVEECLVKSKDELLRPGFSRLSLPSVGTTPDLEDYVVNAVSWVAQHGWKMMHVYRCNHRTGEWRHKSRPGAPLGKTERRWLSHYRALNETNGAKSIPSTLPPTLNEAFETANQLLEAALQDQSSLTQAAKMTQEEEDSSMLSSLRWYVYPKEVAPFCQKGVDHVPLTMDRHALVGSIHPVAWFPFTDLNPPSSNGLMESQKEHVNGGSSTNTHIVQFREGDHSGTAPLDEVELGFEDGELTEACLIYDASSDSWEPIKVMLDRFKQNPSTETHEDSPSREAHLILNGCSGDSKDSNDAIHPATKDASEDCNLPNGRASVLVPTPLSEVDENIEGYFNGADGSARPMDAPIVVTKEMKKPQRDSSKWGQGSMVPLKPQHVDLPSDEAEPPKKARHKHTKPPAKLMRLVTQAMIQWDMLEEGDRLLLGLSGGKDSMALLHVLMEFQKKLPINFEIEVCTIDPMTASFDPSPLISYVESLGLKYHYIRDDIVNRANSAGKNGEIVSSLCSYCARMKRGNLYACARKNNCNKLVLAQHLDDLAESFMMSVMHNGFLRTMKANYKINAGDLSVIRPLVYCREALTAEFSKSANFPIINENCPACFEEPKERARIKKLLSREESLYPNFYDNIKRSILPLMHDDSTAILRSYTEEALAKSQKEKRTNGRQNERKQGKGKRLQENGNTLSEQIVHGKVTNTKDADHQTDGMRISLTEASDDELIRELARRRAEKYRMAGAMKRLEDDEDPTGQVCTLNGGNGTIPCRELME